MTFDDSPIGLVVPKHAYSFIMTTSLEYQNSSI